MRIWIIVFMILGVVSNVTFNLGDREITLDLRSLFTLIAFIMFLFY